MFASDCFDFWICRVTHTDVDPYTMIDPLQPKSRKYNIMFFLYNKIYLYFGGSDIFVPNTIIFYYIKKTLYYISYYFGKRINHFIGVNICMRYPSFI